jgi:hypothetical protein
MDRDSRGTFSSTPTAYKETGSLRADARTFYTLLTDHSLGSIRLVLKKSMCQTGSR